MKRIVIICLLCVLASCGDNKQNTKVSTNKTSVNTEIDGTKTDAVDTLVQKQAIIDSLKTAHDSLKNLQGQNEE